MAHADHLTDEALAVRLKAIFDGLAETSLADRDSARALYDDITDVLDCLDDSDFFGTEGWKHRFGIED